MQSRRRLRPRSAIANTTGSIKEGYACTPSKTTTCASLASSASRLAARSTAAWATTARAENRVPEGYPGRCDTSVSVVTNGARPSTRSARTATGCEPFQAPAVHVRRGVLRQRLSRHRRRAAPLDGPKRARGEGTCAATNDCAQDGMGCYSATDGGSFSASGTATTRAKPARTTPVAACGRGLRRMSVRRDMQPDQLERSAPDVAGHLREVTDLEPDTGLFRVLRDDGTADPETDPRLPTSACSCAATARCGGCALLDARMIVLQRQGRVGFYGACTRAGGDADRDRARAREGRLGLPGAARAERDARARLSARVSSSRRSSATRATCSRAGRCRATSRAAR